MTPGKWIVVLICFLIALYFIVSGIIAIRFRKMTVVNPDHHSAWPGLLGKFIYRELTKHTPRWELDHSSKKQIQGREALARGVFNLFFGMVSLIIVFVYLWQELK